MSDNPFISLIVTHYNDLTLTKECVNSLLQSDYPKFEIIVVDNASSDDSVKRLRKLYKYKHSVKIIQNKVNGFITGGYNFGARFAKGKYLIFLNNDVTVSKKWLIKLKDCSQNHPHAIFQPKVMSYWQKNQIDSVGGRYDIFGFGHGLRIPRNNGCSQVDYAVATIMMFNKKDFINLGGFDECFKTHYEDVDIALRAKRHGILCYVCLNSVVYHKVSWTYKHQTPSDLIKFHVRKNRLLVIKNNYYGLSKYFRLLVIIPFYIILILKDFLSLKKESLFVTIKALTYVFRN